MSQNIVPRTQRDKHIKLIFWRRKVCFVFFFGGGEAGAGTMTFSSNQLEFVGQAPTIWSLQQNFWTNLDKFGQMGQVPTGPHVVPATIIIIVAGTTLC